METKVINDDFDYVGIDLAGYRFNSKYPPNVILYGDTYCGYKNWNREVFFYEFAIRGYDVSFKYKSKSYYLLYEPDHVALCDENFTDEFSSYSNAVELIENLIIEENKLIDIIDILEDVEIM